MVLSYLNEVWRILLELSPPLLAGLLLAGLLHIFLPAGFIHRTLSKPGFASTLKAVLVGVPMPLCSCGVVPTALALRREGASNGATTGFLISTPSTGVDSILVSGAFLGWPFAIFKVFAAFITGIIGGIIADRVTPDQVVAPAPVAVADEPKQRGNIQEVIHYAVVDLYGAIDRWILAGVLIAAAITVLMPADFFQNIAWAQGLAGMLLMLAISIPLYVCTTGSVPIAAAFIAAGMPLGTALVFLMAGPATNLATIGAVYRALGGRLLGVYLATVIVMSIAFGMGFGFVLYDATAQQPMHEHGTDWLGIGSAFIVIALTLYLNLKRYLAQRKHPINQYREFDMGLTLKVEGMSCQHCVASVKNTLEGIEGVESATPDLGSGDVIVTGEDLDRDKLETAVRDAGYQIKQ
ncbi:MAG: permease [Gammaproteobacteria bacterium]|nr:permease [Gammaproteobacteria bacterium]